MILKELRNKYKLIFKEKDFPEHEADIIICHTLNLNVSDFILNGDRIITEEETKLLENMINQRISHIPLQRILGTAPFYGYEFFTEDCLIPRFDTEVLVENACKYLFSGVKVLDIFTGSGCIIISLFNLYKEKYSDIPLDSNGKPAFFACDISKKALITAKKNSTKYDTNIHFFESDITSSIQKGSKFDIITANPPYIKSREIWDLDIEVKDYDPILALDGGEDGLKFYRRLANSLGDFLSENGVILMEIGCDQGESVCDIFYNAGYTGIEVIKDLAGYDRVVCVKG